MAELPRTGPDEGVHTIGLALSHPPEGQELMFYTFCAIISPEWTHRCQGSSDRKAEAASGHLTLPPIPRATGTVSRERVAPRA